MPCSVAKGHQRVHRPGRQLLILWFQGQDGPLTPHALYPALGGAGIWLQDGASLSREGSVSQGPCWGRAAKET